LLGTSIVRLNQLRSQLAEDNGHATVPKASCEVRDTATELVDECNLTRLLLAAAVGHEALVGLLLGILFTMPFFYSAVVDLIQKSLEVGLG
jgi:hypothetical protein